MCTNLFQEKKNQKKTARRNGKTSKRLKESERSKREPIRMLEECRLEKEVEMTVTAFKERRHKRSGNLEIPKTL